MMSCGISSPVGVSTGTATIVLVALGRFDSEVSGSIGRGWTWAQSVDEYGVFFLFFSFEIDSVYRYGCVCIGPCSGHGYSVFDYWSPMYILYVRSNREFCRRESVVWCVAGDTH